MKYYLVSKTYKGKIKTLLIRKHYIYTELAYQIKARKVHRKGWTLLRSPGGVAIDSQYRKAIEVGIFIDSYGTDWSAMQISKEEAAMIMFEAGDE